jgi:hypothetical protein
MRPTSTGALEWLIASACRQARKAGVVSHTSHHSRLELLEVSKLRERATDSSGWSDCGRHDESKLAVGTWTLSREAAN